MRLIFFTVFFAVSNLLFSQDVNHNASKKTKRLFAEISKIIKHNSLFSDSLNWPQLSVDYQSLIFVNNDSIDRKTIFDFFTKKLRSVGDKHSFFITQANINSYTSKNSEPALPSGKYLGDGIGLIKVPMCMTFSNTKDRDFANSIRSQIRKLDTEYEITSWVVDLRNNSGGNMWPMIAGLNALVEDGVIGYVVGTANRKEREWRSANGKINFSNEATGLYKVKRLNNKIAVLIDSLTASSGEMTAISFIGLPNVKLFGQPSAGYTTANSTRYLSDGSQLFLATNFIADRTHKIYRDKIFPDVIVSGQNAFDIDKTLEAAKKWLLQVEIK